MNLLARIPPKQKAEQMENSSPNPSFSICDIRIQKQMSRSFGKPFPQKIVLPKLRPHCPATCLNTWKAEPRKKNPLSFFKRNFTPAKSRKQGVFFFLGCRGSARQWRNDSFSLKKSSSKCYNDTTKRNIVGIRKMERFCGSQNRTINFFKTLSAYGGSGEFPKFPPIEIMKDLKPKYFLYARKSTEDDDHQIMSIEAQLFELHEYARKENLEILEEFQESKSAKKPGRELFGEMMTRIEQGEANGIIAWHPDRLARNSVDGGRVIYLVDTEQIAFFRFPTFWFEPTPQGKFMLQVAFGQSKYYSDNLVENINRGIRQKVRRGEWLVRAPFGYINNPKARNIEPHPTKSRIIVKAFEEYAKGTHTLGSIANFLADHGITTHGKPPAKSSVAKMLTHRVYIGFTHHKGEWNDGSFAPIISPTLFEAVQKMLAKKSRPRKQTEKYLFPFTGFARCGECGSMITAQYATNRFGTKYT